MAHTTATATDQERIIRALKILVVAPLVIAGTILWWAWLLAILGLVIFSPFLILGWLFR